MKLGVVARFDEGGLGVMTWEAARHLAPDELMLVECPPCRGEEHRERFAGLAPSVRYVSHPSQLGDSARWAAFVEACDVIYTAETTYLPDLHVLCAAAGVRLVVHAMPELYDSGSKPLFDVWAPTSWLQPLLPASTQLVPVPVDRVRCASRPITEVRTMLHVSSPAMLDRNGTELVRAALPYCQHPFELLISGPGKPPEPVTVGPVIVRPIEPVRDYWRLYDDVQALVLPRRYGGLSLPMQEAASCGLPIVSINVEPQKRWLCPWLAVPEHRLTSARMKGGQINVWSCDPKLLAQRIDALVACDPAPAVTASELWAHSLDWERWAGIYRRLLRCD